MVQAHGTAGDLIFAQGFPSAADRHAGQAMLDVQHGQHHQEQHDVDEHELDVGVVIDAEELMERNPAILRALAELQAEKRRRRHRHAVRAAGERQPVVEHQANDFTEAQGHDGQVVAVHAQHREPEDAPRQSRRDGRQRQYGPETQAEVLIAQRQAVGTDGVERHVTEVEQAGQAHHDVQAQAQQHVDQPEDHHGQQVLVGEDREHDGDHDQGRDDPAQPRLVVRRQHMHPRTTGLEALQNLQALGGLQEEAQGKAPGHHNSDQQADAGRFQVEAVAVEDHADDRTEHDQGNQPGEDRIDHTFLDIDGFGSRHVYTFATSGRPSRP